MSSLTTTASVSSERASTMDVYQTPQSSAISEHSTMTGTPQAIRDWLMSLQPGSPASRSVPQENAPGPTTPATCGPQQSSASAWYDRDTACWRTYQDSFLLDTLEPFSETWPKAGMTLAGVFYPQPKLELRIDVIGCSLWDTPSKADAHPRALNRTGPYWGPGQKHLQAQAYNAMYPTPTDPSKGGGSSRSGDRRGEIPTLQGMARAGMWPTPNKWDGQRGPDARDRPGSGGPNLVHAVKNWPTPTKSDFQTRRASENWDGGDLVATVTAIEEQGGNQQPVSGGKLNPTWVEWLMGWPLNWTSLEPLSAQGFNEWHAPGWWANEPPDVPRVTTITKDRVDRLKAIGNGQVPMTVAAVWRLLTATPEQLTLDDGMERPQ